MESAVSAQITLYCAVKSEGQGPQSFYYKLSSSKVLQEPNQRILDVLPTRVQ